MGRSGILKKIGVAVAAVAAAILMAPAAFAEQAHDWELGMQPAATPVRDHIDALHDELLIIITLITLFVLGLLLFVMIRFNAKRNPVPSNTSHNSLLELIWTAVPVLILLAIVIPSFKLMYYMDRIPTPDLTLKVTGHQWYWTYAYPDQGNITFDSNVLSDADDAKEGQAAPVGRRQPVIVPVGAVVRIL